MVDRILHPYACCGGPTRRRRYTIIECKCVIPSKNCQRVSARVSGAHFDRCGHLAPRKFNAVENFVRKFCEINFPRAVPSLHGNRHGLNVKKSRGARERLDQQPQQRERKRIACCCCECGLVDSPEEGARACTHIESHTHGTPHTHTQVHIRTQEERARE